MARLLKIAAPGTPYHATRQGNRCQHAFLEDDDYTLYRICSQRIALQTVWPSGPTA